MAIVWLPPLQGDFIQTMSIHLNFTSDLQQLKQNSQTIVQQLHVFKCVNLFICIGIYCKCMKMLKIISYISHVTADEIIK